MRREHGHGPQEEAGSSGHVQVCSGRHGYCRTLEHGVEEEEYVQVIKSLISVLLWRMCVTT